MTWIDYSIIAAFVALLVWIAISTNRITKSVAGFLSSERCAGRYLLTLAQAMAFISAASFVGGWQAYYRNGFGGFWWMLTSIPVSAALAMSGWVMYRYRSTRALTMPQFLEMRYSRNFRIFAGFLAFIAGVLNCGFFPAVTARFIMAFTDMPTYFGETGIPVYPFFLALLVITPLTLAIAGGQISIMVTDFFQGMITNIAVLAITFYMLTKFDIDAVMVTLLQAPEGHSLVNPFKQGELPDFGPIYFFMMIFIRIFTHGVWQGNSGYMSSARNPHEGRMATMLGEWRNCVSWTFMIIPIFIWAIMQNPELGNGIGQQISDSLAQFTLAHEQAEQVVPLGLKVILPTGLIGLLIIMMLGAAVSTDDSAYHSWGSIFLQDAIMPFRKKPFSPKAHILALRLSIVGIGLFAYLFSLTFTLQEYLPMWTFITSSIFIGGAGCAVIGGLYWSRGTVQGAWTSIVIGSVLSGGTIILKQFWQDIPALNNWIPFEDLPNGLEMSCIVTLLSLSAYVLVSLATCRKPHNMDKMLHRGEYAIEEDIADAEKEKQTKRRKVSWLARKLGFTEEFNRVDKIIYIAQYAWIGMWALVFFAGTAYHFYRESIGDPIPDTAWLGWWKIHVGIFIAMAAIVTVWYGIGGAFNLVDLYRTLKDKKTDNADDGTVHSD